MEDLDLITSEELDMLSDGKTSVMVFLRQVHARTGIPMCEAKGLADRIRDELGIPHGLRGRKK